MARVLLVFCAFLCSTLLANTEWEREGIVIQRNYNPDVQGKKIAILTMIISGEEQENNELIKYEDTVAFGTRSKEIYAKKHGYDLITATRKLRDCYGIPPKNDWSYIWTRLTLVSRVLSEYDWVFWLDADSIILNLDIPLENFMDEQFDVIACNRQNKKFNPTYYDNVGQINHGAVLYKNSSFCKDLIIAAWKLKNVRTQCKYDKIMGDLLKDSKYWNHILVFPYTAFNQKHAFFQEGDFIVHFSKIHGKRLRDTFNYYEEQYQERFDQIDNE